MLMTTTIAGRLLLFVVVRHKHAAFNLKSGREQEKKYMERINEMDAI